MRLMQRREGGLAAAGGANDGGDFEGFNSQMDVMEGLVLAVEEADIGDFDGGGEVGGGDFGGKSGGCLVQSLGARQCVAEGGGEVWR